MTKPTVIIHTDATGWVDFLMNGDVNVYPEQAMEVAKAMLMLVGKKE